MKPITRQLQLLALTSYGLLLSWMGIWHFFLASDQPYSPGFVVLMYILPLLLPARGLLKGRPYTYAWANFITLLYIIHGITIAYADQDERMYAIIELVLACAMFTGCSLFARYRGKELGQALPKLKQEMQDEQARYKKH